jgi:galactokinase
MTPSLIERLVELEPTTGGDGRTPLVVRAPGRVNLIGEYTDINDGFVLPAAIDLEIRIAFVPSADRRVSLVRLDTGQSAEFALDALPDRRGDWTDYVVGTAWSLDRAGVQLRGVRGVIDASLPMNAGLSSSAAIELAVARALLDPHAAIEPMALARLAQQAENEFVGVQSGLMDQFAVACGIRDAALLLDCRSLEWRPVPLPHDDVALVVCNSGADRSLASSAYNERRAECEAAVEALARDDPSVRSLRDVTAAHLAAAEERGIVTGIPARRARHVVTENVRVQQTIAALEAGDMGAIGQAFAASHLSLRDDFEVSSPALDALVEIAISVPGVVAARMTGAGFGGCTVNLVRHEAVPAFREAIETRYPVATGLRPTVYVVRPVEGAGIGADA